MVKRMAIIGGATVLAAAVLLATFLGDTPNLPTGREATPDIAPGPQTPGVTAQDLRRTPAKPEDGPIATGQYQVERLDRGKLWQFWGDRVTPLPQGLMRVDAPGMRMHMEPWRVLQITAVRGMFVAPGNQPRSGDFEGDVVVTLYESPDASRPNLDDDSPHVKLRLYLDEAAFDVEMGQIDSNSPVHLTGPAVDFVGNGLRINYNDRRNRIERLEVATGEMLRIKPREAREQPARDRDDAQPLVALPPGAPRASREPQPPTPRQERQRQREERQREQAAAEPQPPQGPQFYRATFENDVRVHSASGTITAQTMEVYFSLEDDDDTPGVTARRQTQPIVSSPREEPSHQTTHIGPHLPWHLRLLTLTLAQVQEMRLPQTRHPTLAPVADDDVIITWSGRLIVSPEAGKPAGLAGPEDRKVVFRAAPTRPVEIVTPRGDTATAAVVEYTEQSQRVAMAASDEHPLAVHSVELGNLRGVSLQIDQSAGTGYVIGPGELVGIDGQAGDGDAAGELRIVWAERLDMTLYPHTPAGDSDRNTSTSLRTADFRGDVKVEHPQFDLTAQRLAVLLSSPAAVNQGSRQGLERIDAAGDVHVVAHGDGDADALAIDAQTLRIDMAATADGRSVPTSMAARDRVKVVRPGQTLWANRLDVGLGVDEGGDDAAGRVAVRTLRAEDNVRVDLASPGESGVAALAHVLIADAVKGEAELFGHASAPARLMREDGELTGQRIVLFENSQQAHVPGPGTLTFVAGQRGEQADAQPTHLNVVWTQAMRYDDHAGTAVFVGDVVAATSSQRDRTRLTARELHLEFFDETPSGDAAATDAMGGLLGGNRAIRKLTATSQADDSAAEAVFLAMSYDGPPDDPASHMDTRFRLAGPSIVFTNPDERVTVTGKGTMLIEDYRGVDVQAQARPAPVEASPPTAAATAGATTPGSTPPIPSSLRPTRTVPQAERPAQDRPVFLTGKGQTLFTWTGSLQLDAANNDMLISDNVVMLHRSPDRTSTVQLNCDRLAADQEPGGGLSVWLGGDAPKPQMRTVKADGNVRIREGSTLILADHAHYDGKSEYVDIFCDARRLVTVQDDDEPLGQLTARKLRWLLPTNRFEVIGPGPGRAPMGIQRRVNR
jgi:hypothetical protein